MKKITIGRAAENNIIFESVETISNYHSEIIIDDYGCMTYCDHSTNGSMVNGNKIHNSSCVVKRGDDIVLPGNSVLDWNLIPSIMQQTVADHVQASAYQQRPAQPQQPQASAYQQRPAQPQAQASAYQQRPAQPQQPQASAYQQRPAQPQQPQSSAYQQRPAQPQAQASAYQQRPAQPQSSAYQQRPAQPQQPQASAYQQRPAQPQQQGYQEYREQLPTNRGLLKMFLFGMLTFGIYNIVLFCKISSEINIVARADRRNTLHYFIVLLLTPMTLGILPFIWMHNLCNRIGNELKRRNIYYNFGSGDFWMWGVLGVFILIGPWVFLHKLLHAMNNLNGSYNLNGE